jgi:uncharacterized protein (UPF0332 family)
LNPEDIKALIQHRLENATDTIKQAETLFQNGFFLGVINRAYYAMFYATLALLLSKDMGSAKHKGVISLFDKHFVKTGQADAKWSKILHHAFEKRQWSDYDDWASTDNIEAERILQDARDFVNWTQEWLKEKGYIG